MELDEKLNYKAYEHQYSKGDILSLKDTKELESINQILLENNESTDIDYLNSINWYLTKEKKELLIYKKLKVVNSISWHMGIPFYILEDIENNSSVVYMGEFYLKKYK